MSRVLQISDTHIVKQGAFANAVVDTNAALASTVETINRSQDKIGPIDLVVVTGDLTDHGTPDEYAVFRDLIAPLHCPLVAVPGNHDDRDAMRTAFSDAPWMPRQGPINLRVDLEDVTVIGIDTLVTDGPYGEICAPTCDWLAEQFGKLDGRPILLAMHHPPFDTGIALMDNQALTNPGYLADVLETYSGPCRVIAGHIHRSIATTFAGHQALVCPGTSHAVSLDLGPTRNNTLMMEPSGMLLHDIGQEITSHLVPLGPFDGPFPFRV